MRILPALTVAGALVGCGGGSDGKAGASREEPVRRAAFRALIAQDFLASCPGGARPEGLREAGRYAELKQLAATKGAGHAIWLGENDHAALTPHAERETCEAGEEPYREALAQYGGTLDAFAGRVADFEE
jgi:hypothetical protein